MSKLLERLALARLQPHLLRSPNYCTLQSAYRPLHSTETALLKVIDDIYRSMDNGSSTALVSLDVSAAVFFPVVCSLISALMELH